MNTARYARHAPVNPVMRPLFIVLLTALAAQNLAAEPKLMIGEFSRNRLDGWEHKSFKSETRYRLQTLDGVVALKADSQAAASGLFKEQRIDLEQTPFLNWSWRIATRLTGLNEQSKAGDDYAARLYIVVKGGLAFWQTKALNYVWVGNTAKDSVWPNAFAGNHAMMLALRGQEATLNVWHNEKRHVKADWQKLFGENISAIDAVALMTDTDNSGGQVSAFYGDIWFSKD
ncbi:DUF3047 domain-containing protein [Methylobacter svalbardensis]|uniref:DUF3047 domain-containing protein n=1 Tax=Methylobacter svalbardensis TaxID=3080016 RepID=UPI0030EC94F5